MASRPSHDQRRKAPQEILSQEIEDALEELRRPTPGLLISALSAGLDIGFGPLLMAATMTLVGEAVPGLTSALLLSVMYSVGFLFVVLGRSELFTEHTTMAMLPVLDRRASLASLGRLWVLIYVGNLVGCVLFSAFATFVATRLDLADSAAFAELANILVNQGFVTILFAGVLAGWLMGLLTWLVAAARDTVSEILIVFLIASVIGFTHLPHAIAGSVEVLMGLFGSEQITLVAYGRFLLGSTVGNAIGGVVFVSLIKYGHAVRQSAGSPADVDPEELT
jgi:formate/nitrite transporter FocA (FNT family)